MRFDINETLLRHIATGGGAAYSLRAAAAQAGSPQLPDAVANFFGARSDIRRLHLAQIVARSIVRIHDFADIMELRDIVAKQELRRLIHYARQRDHTAHTVYLYLLGVWFFDSLPQVRAAIEAYSGCRDEKVYGWFLYQWLFASLLHDIGYAFYDLSNDTGADRQRIDEMYSWTWLEKQVKGPDAQRPGARPPTASTMKKLKGIYERWDREYGSHMPSETASYGPFGTEAVLNRLAAAPWLGDLNKKWKNKSIFDVLTFKSAEVSLKQYAMTVAKRGYSADGEPNGEPSVDHAVASGLLLFQYTSYWYWIMAQLKPGTSAHREAAAGHDYDIAKIEKHLVPACRAAAYHNVLPKVPGADRVLRGLTLEGEPILYLSILCDELQRWDRFPAGEALFRDTTKTATTSLEADDLELVCDGATTRGARLYISQPLGISPKDYSDDLEKLRKDLLRAPNYHQLIRIEEGRDRNGREQI